MASPGYHGMHTSSRGAAVSPLLPALTAIMKELFGILQWFAGFVDGHCAFLMENHVFIQQIRTEHRLCARHNLKIWA